MELSNHDDLNNLLLLDRRIRLKRLAETLRISYDFYFVRIRRRKNLQNIFSNSWTRIKSKPAWKLKFENDPNFLNCVIITNKTWVHFYYPERKQQLMEWKNSGSSRRKRFRSARKILASVFCDWVIISLTWTTVKLQGKYYY